VSEPFEILGERQVLDHPYLKLSVITARDPRGNEFDALLGSGPDLVYVVPLWPDDTVTLIRTHRIGFDGTCIEVPGGHVNPEEGLRNAALRELREETGLESAELTPLFTCMLSGKIQQRVHLFVAENLTPGDQQLDTGEAIVPPPASPAGRCVRSPGDRRPLRVQRSGAAAPSTRRASRAGACLPRACASRAAWARSAPRR